MGGGRRDSSIPIWIVELHTSHLPLWLTCEGEELRIESALSEIVLENGSPGRIGVCALGKYTPYKVIYMWWVFKLVFPLNTKLKCNIVRSLYGSFMPWNLYFFSHQISFRYLHSSNPNSIGVKYSLVGSGMPFFVSFLLH